MFSIFPRDDRFYILLEKLTAEVVTSSQSLKTLITSQSETERQIAFETISANKTAAKNLSQEITRELCSCFVTPFDREDIQSITENLYKIPKVNEKICERLSIHKLDGVQEDFSPQVTVIAEEAEVLRSLMQDLIGKGSHKKLPAKVDELHHLEQKGDMARADLLAALYASERDIRDLLIRRDIYDMLERVVDRFRDVSSVALQIVLKQG